jgi:negative regulator of genetic competence, sporulation and motility
MSRIFDNPEFYDSPDKISKSKSKKSIFDEMNDDIQPIAKPNITEHLKTLKYKQLKAIAKFHNLHYVIKLNSRNNIINALSKLYDYKNGKYGSKPFNIILKDNTVKQSVDVKKRSKDDEFIINLINKQGSKKTIQDVIKNL